MNFVKVVWFWMNLLHFWDIIPFHNAKRILIPRAFQRFHFGTHMARARFNLKAIICWFYFKRRISRGENAWKIVYIDKMWAQNQAHARSVRAKVKAMIRHENLLAFCFIEHNHSSKMEQMHPKSNNFYEIHFFVKNHNFQDLPSIYERGLKRPFFIDPSNFPYFILQFYPFTQIKKDRKVKK